MFEEIINGLNHNPFSGMMDLFFIFLLNNFDISESIYIDYNIEWIYHVNKILKFIIYKISQKPNSTNNLKI